MLSIIIAGGGSVAITLGGIAAGFTSDELLMLLPVHLLWGMLSAYIFG
ncbi:hypothetical protein [Pectobacterium phage PPWS2]|uniref:Uncharacterized protein n=1 Tax=Pectobacterium phage PPWS2 TaxID=2153295 RepID=A0A3G9ESC9_9CAUD|nr:hypothetical protein HOU58_gp16 [Pectobacterium phage PPWS2]BBD74648.1 hypothetical protein [Pectobacterium phage PPWS2]